jgi:alpha-beta hydrolase superfamily lysophospholipase
MRGHQTFSEQNSATTLSLELLGVEEGPVVDGVEHLRLETDAGLISCRYHEAPHGDAAVVWVGGAGGGMDGPAHGLYPRLAGRLVGDGISSLRLDYRHPHFLEACVLDTLLGTAFLGIRGRLRVALVGHSFGGAVVITAGVMSEPVLAVAALSSQTFGTELISQLSPRPLLLIHGEDDEILPEDCSRELYQRAQEPRTLLLYPSCGHGLDECRDRLDHDLTAWLRRALAPPL